MANWREILISGSDGVLQSLKTDNSIQVSGSIHLSQSIHDTNDNTVEEIAYDNAEIIDPNKTNSELMDNFKSNRVS